MNLFRHRESASAEKTYVLPGPDKGCATLREYLPSGKIGVIASRLTYGEEVFVECSGFGQALKPFSVGETSALKAIVAQCAQCEGSPTPRNCPIGSLIVDARPGPNVG